MPQIFHKKKKCSNKNNIQKFEKMKKRFGKVGSKFVWENYCLPNSALKLERKVESKKSKRGCSNRHQF